MGEDQDEGLFAARSVKHCSMFDGRLQKLVVKTAPMPEMQV